MNTNNGYESLLSARAARHRRKRDVRKRREELAKQKLQISSGPILRSLKGAARKQLIKERAPTLWILPADINFRRSHCSDYPKASLLGLPAELRQNILLLSFDVRVIVSEEMYYQPRRYRDKPRDFRAKKMRTVSKKLSNNPHQRTMDRLNDKVAELCQLHRIVSDDMRYIGRYWQRVIESITDKKIYVDALKFPDFAKPVPIPMYESKRKRGRFVKGDDRPLKGKRSGKCWYCTERHDTSGCTRANENPQKWFQDTKPV